MTFGSDPPETVSMAFPMLPKRADRADSARTIARLFCQRTGWTNDETGAELEIFLVASVENWCEYIGGKNERRMIREVIVRNLKIKMCRK